MLESREDEDTAPCNGQHPCLLQLTGLNTFSTHRVYETATRKQDVRIGLDCHRELH